MSFESSELEDISSAVSSTSLNFDTDSIIENLESEDYIKQHYNAYFKSDVETKLGDFTNWFSSTARLYFLKCNYPEKESLLYQLINLKRQVKYAISELNSTVSKNKKTYACNSCNENITINPRENIWTVLQNHDHFEETYVNALKNPIQYHEEIITEITKGVEGVKLDDTLLVQTKQRSQPPLPSHLNDFRFNFTIKYDPIVEEAFYPAIILQEARKIDKVPDYTLQRISTNRGICLLCKVYFTCTGNGFNINDFRLKSHLNEPSHKKSAKSKNDLEFLLKYHEFWRSQETDYQCHQSYFFPESEHFQGLNCHLCLENVEYSSIINHINGDKHRNKFQIVFELADNNDLYLIKEQAKVYQIKMNSNIVQPVATTSKNNEVSPKSSENKRRSLPPVPVANRNRDKIRHRDMKNGDSKCEIIPSVVTEANYFLAERYIEHKKFFQNIAGGLVRCSLCKININLDAKTIQNHILIAPHSKLADVQNPTYSFFCEICNLKFSEESAWQDHFLKGNNKHELLGETRRQRVTEYECRTCKLIIFGDQISLNRHKFPRNRNGKSKAHLELPSNVKKFFISKEFIFEESERLRLEALKVSDGFHKMKNCCEDLVKAVVEIYPNAKAYPFGSRKSGLGAENSDLDVFLDVGDMYLGDKFQEGQHQKQFVNKVTKLLRNNKYDFKIITSIGNARTPIVRLRHCYTGLECDVSFRHGLGVENTKFLRFCIDLQPITQPLILLLKKWSEYCKLNEEISNYGLALLAIFYLQVGGYLMPVSKIRQLNPLPSQVIDGWQTINYTLPIEKMREFLKPCSLNITQLLRNFFYYYSEFDYANNVVCPLMGYTLTKFAINETPMKLPPEMLAYTNKVKNHNGEIFRGLSPFCIQDPFDLSHNLTKACPHDTTTKFKTLCKLTYQFLDTIN